MLESAAMTRVKDRPGGRDPGNGSTTALSSVVENILSLIRKGRLVPGQRLVEIDLMQALGVKRGPIREALRLLAGDGIVEILPNRGARVRSLSKQEIIDMMEVIGALQHLASMLTLKRGLDNIDTTSVKRSRDGIVEAMMGRASKEDILKAISDHQYELNKLSGNGSISVAMRTVHMEYFGYIIARAISPATLMECAAANVELADAIIARRYDQVIEIGERNHRLIMNALRAADLAI